MSVLVVTSAGELVIDLFCDDCPVTTKNFLKLCKIKYYNDVLFYNVQHNLLVQTGDPTGTGEGGTSIYGIVEGEKQRYFRDEIVKHRKHDSIGVVSMANKGPNLNSSQFFITTRGEELDHLDGKHTVFGIVEEGLDVLEKLNALYCDDDDRPLQDVRIMHTYVLDDPFEDLPNMQSLIPPSSPVRDRHPDETVGSRIPYGTSLEEDEATSKEIEERIQEKEAKSRAVVLEMVGDLPDAEIEAPDNVLFVCKLNPATTDEDLELIFARFGRIKCCEIIRDHITGDSLNYAFIEFETVDSCNEAYAKMNNVLIDDRRIKVDFSQSVAKLWNKYALTAVTDKSRGRGGGKADNNPPANPIFTNITLKSGRQSGNYGMVHDHDHDERTEERDRHHKHRHKKDRDRDRSRERNQSDKRDRKDRDRKHSRSRSREGHRGHGRREDDSDRRRR